MIQKGRNVRVEVATLFGAAKIVTAVSKANPGVASSAAHGLANASIGFFDNVLGMTELDGQVCCVANQASGTFELQALDTSGFGTFTAGEFIPVTTWKTLSQATSYEIGGGEADKLDGTTLLDTVKQEENGMLSAQTVTFNAFSDPQAEAFSQIRKDAKSGAYSVFRITFPNGERRIFRGQASLPGESVQLSALATGGFSVTVKRDVIYLPSA